MKRLISMVLATSAAVGLLAGCGQQNGGTPAPANSSAPAPVAATASAAPQGETKTEAGPKNEVVTLKGWSAFAFNDTTGNKSYSDHIAWKEIEKNLGIKVDWTTVTTTNDNGPTQFGLLMAAQDLPDFFVDLNPLLLEEYGRKGALLSLEGLIKSDIPELDKLLQADPGARGSITSEDGHIYFFPRLLGDVGTRCWPGYMIREDWLEKVGMKTPETVDDMYNALKAFKEQIPAAKPYTGDPKPFFWAFGVGSRGTGNTNDDTFLEDGVIKFGPTDSRYKEALQYLNKLYTEGLLDAEWNGISGDQITTNIMTEVSGSSFGSFSGALGKYNNLFLKDGKGEPLVAVAPLKGPQGTAATQGLHTSIDLGNAGAIAVTTKHAADIARLFNYTYSPEGALACYFGIEGDTYQMVDGKPQYTEKVVKHDLGTMGYINNYIFDLSCYPSNYPLTVYHSILSPEGIRGNKITTENTGTIKVPALRFSETEISDINSILRDINAYVDESMAGFINGQKDFGQWDAYVASFDKLHLEKLLKIYNEAYQRFLVATKA